MVVELKKWMMLAMAGIICLFTTSAKSEILTQLPNDPYFTEFEWYASKLGLPQAWAISTGSPNVRVAVLDTGVRADSPDITGRVLPTLTNVESVGGFAQLDGTLLHHGTWVSSAIAMGVNNGIGGAGIGNFSILPITVTDSSGVNNATAMAQAIRLAADAGARVIVIAQSAPTYDEMDAAAEYARSEGALTFVASGNMNTGRLLGPYPNLIFVSGTDEQDARWQSGVVGSTYGPFVDLAAPATNILVEDGLTSTGADLYGTTTGTSMSVALAGGAAALAWSINPNLTPDQVQNLLYTTAVDLGAPGWDEQFGYGRLNVGALAFAAEATVPEPATLMIISLGMCLLLCRRPTFSSRHDTHRNRSVVPAESHCRL